MSEGNSIYETLLSWVPIWLRPLIGALFIIMLVVVLYKNLFTKKSSDSPDTFPTCKSYTLIGKLIDGQKNIPMEAVSKVSIENTPLLHDDFLAGGIFVIEKVQLPENKIISLFIEYGKDKSFRVDVDLNFTELDNCRINCKDIRVLTESFPKGENSSKIRNNESSRRNIQGISESRVEIVEQKDKYQLVVISAPELSPVYLNGEFSGSTPLEMALEEGAYEILINKVGYHPFHDKVHIPKQKIISITLKKGV